MNNKCNGEFKTSYWEADSDIVSEYYIGGTQFKYRPEY
jgi:hypothetical protein